MPLFSRSTALAGLLVVFSLPGFCKPGDDSTFPSSKKVSGGGQDLSGLWISTEIKSFDGAQQRPFPNELIHVTQRGNNVVASEVRLGNPKRNTRYVWGGTLSGSDSLLGMTRLIWAANASSFGQYYDSRIRITGPDTMELFAPEPVGDSDAAAGWLVIHRISSDERLLGLPLPHFLSCPATPQDSAHLSSSESATFDRFKKTLTANLAELRPDLRGQPKMSAEWHSLAALWEAELTRYEAEPVTSCQPLPPVCSTQFAAAASADVLTDAAIGLVRTCPSCFENLTFAAARTLVTQALMAGLEVTVTVAGAAAPFPLIFYPNEVARDEDSLPPEDRRPVTDQEYLAAMNNLRTKMAASKGRICIKAETPPPPGNCTEQQHRALQDRVDNACKSARACTANDSAGVLSAKIGQHSACIAARKKINDVCFRGGDSGHREAITNRVNAIAACQKFLSRPPK